MRSRIAALWLLIALGTGCGVDEADLVGAQCTPIAVLNRCGTTLVCNPATNRCELPDAGR